MYIYDKELDEFHQIQETEFKRHNIRERQDLEKWVLQSPEILNEELLIINSEHDKFDKTRERSDILALDKSGKLVIVELKLDDSGRSVEFQALKYASYYSTLTYDDLITLKAEYERNDDKEIIKQEIDGFIENSDFEQLDDKPRIILVSKEYRPEVTSTVLWLRKFDLDIACIKLTPFLIDENKIGITSQKIIPLPEAEEYIIKLERKENISKTLTRSQQEYISFYTELIEMIRRELPENYRPASPRNYYQISTIPGGTHFEWAFHGRHRSSFGVELHFESSKQKNYERIQYILDRRNELDEDLNEQLHFEKEWGKIGSRIFMEYTPGKMTDELKKWAVNNMIKFIQNFKPLLEKMD